MVPDSPERPAGRGAVALTLAVLVLAACTGPDRGGHEMLNAVLWQQRAPEYRAAAMQAYTLAQTRLEEGLATGWSAALEQPDADPALPPAVLLDVDETVIDNSRYEARIVRQLGRYDRDSFARWCAEDAAGAVPGAVPFVRSARALGVAVIFYTAREERLRDCTLASLRRLGFGPVSPGELYLRGAGSKHALRERLAQRYRLVLLIGDSLEDFVAGSRAGAGVRDALARRHAERFGHQWIVLPNPVYGHWEALWYDFDYTAPRDEMVERKRGALAP
jgi:acid phosphatase